MRKRKWWIVVILAVVIAYFAGPAPSRPHYSEKLPVVPAGTAALETFIRQKESLHKIKRDNEARIVWANDTSKAVTEYSILYLHGFSASQGEGDPVHKTVAKKYRCNLYLSRLAEHGIDTTERLINLTADELWESAKEAYVIASHIGKKVIVVGTSTGGSLALMLAARYPQIHSLILLSPNIEIFDSNAWILNNPWGLQLARMINGSDYVISKDTRPVYRQYWTYNYRLEAVVQLQEMLESGMKPEIFKKVQQPVLMLYYYRDSIHHDSVVNVSAMLKMFNELGTPATKKRSVPLPDTGDHVIGSYIKSHDLASVEREIEKFMTEVLKIN